MAVPKRKVSKARRDKRRSSVDKLSMPGMVKCPTAASTIWLTEYAALAASMTASR